MVGRRPRLDRPSPPTWARRAFCAAKPSRCACAGLGAILLLLAVACGRLPHRALLRRPRRLVVHVAAHARSFRRWPHALDRRTVPRSSSASCRFQSLASIVACTSALQLPACTLHVRAPCRPVDPRPFADRLCPRRAAAITIDGMHPQLLAGAVTRRCLPAIRRIGNSRFGPFMRRSAVAAGHQIEYSLQVGRSLEVERPFLVYL